MWSAQGGYWLTVRSALRGIVHDKGRQEKTVKLRPGCNNCQVCTLRDWILLTLGSDQPDYILRRPGSALLRCGNQGKSILSISNVSFTLSSPPTGVPLPRESKEKKRGKTGREPSWDPRYKLLLKTFKPRGTFIVKNFERFMTTKYIPSLSDQQVALKRQG